MKLSINDGECKTPYAFVGCVDFIKNPKRCIQSIHYYITECCCDSCLEYLDNVVCLEYIDTMRCKCEDCIVFYLYHSLSVYEYMFKKCKLYN